MIVLSPSSFAHHHITVNNFYTNEFIKLQRGVVSRHAHYASVISTLFNHPNSVGGKKGSVAARGTMASIVHTSTCAASVSQLWLRNYWDTRTDTLAEMTGIYVICVSCNCCSYYVTTMLVSGMFDYVIASTLA